MMTLSTSRLSDVARHVIRPDAIKTTGWPKVRDTCRRLGWEFDQWQDGAGQLILGKRTDGLYAADTIVLSIPRQVGKTYLVACIIFALCLIHPGLTVIWTAHRKTTAAETFASFDGMAKRARVAPHIRQVLRGKGDEKILFTNGRGFCSGLASLGLVAVSLMSTSWSSMRRRSSLRRRWRIWRRRRTWPRIR
jgi:phage terminase large subunit-like protein